MRAPFLTLTLSAGVAFSAAWGIASLRRSAEPGKSKAASTIPALLADTVTSENQDANPVVAVSAGVLGDALVRQAVEGADLTAGVREIMAHQNEDHCADSRLVCMVENLPLARLAELPALLDQFISDDYVVKFVLGAWAQRDAAGALSWVQAHPGLNDSGVQSFLRGWTRAAPEAALAWVEALPVSTGSGALRTSIVEAMAERNPSAALALMQERGWTAQHPDAVLRLLSNWGGRDPAAALDGLRTLTADMGLKLEKELAGTSPGFSSTNQSFRCMLQALLYGAFERNPADAAALLSRLSPEEMAAGQDAVADEIIARDPSIAEALFAAPPNESTRRMLLALAGASPEMALANLGRVQDKALRQEFFRAATSSHNLSEQNAVLPAEALPVLREALEGIPDADEHNRIAAELSKLAASSAPQWAAELWQGLPEMEQLRSAHQFILKATASDAGAVLHAYAASPPNVQTQSLKSLCFALGSSQPDAALQLVLERTEPAVRAECAAALFATWVTTNEQTAFAALKQYAGELDVAKVLDALPQAGQFSYRNQSATRSFSYSTTEDISTTSLRAMLQQLRDSTPTKTP